MSRTRQRIPAAQRLRSAADFARLRAEGRAVRGQHCLVVVAECPGEPRKVAFVASRKGVGGAVQRNRARRRMREIVRRRWPALATSGEGRWMMFVANRSILNAPHEQLVADLERLIARVLSSEPTGETS
jgi:ribonuclease P protein component